MQQFHRCVICRYIRSFFTLQLFKKGIYPCKPSLPVRDIAGITSRRRPEAGGKAFRFQGAFWPAATAHGLFASPVAENKGRRRPLILLA